MKKIVLIPLFLTTLSYAQTDNNIEGVVLNTPCKMEFTRSSKGLNNYSCTIQKDGDKIINYSVTAENMTSRMQNLSDSELKTFKETYFTVVKNNSEANNETTTFINLSPSIKALKSKGTMNYQGQVIYTTTITFFKNQKSYMFNVLTNINDGKILADLTNKIKL